MPDTWIALCGLAFGLGARHGFDADHLTVIDAIARRNLPRRPVIARLAGCLFSIGHGVVVCIASILTICVTAQWRMPAWLDLTGAILSIVILLGLAVANLSTALLGGRSGVVAPIGFRSRLFPDHGRADHPIAIMVTGMVFAISFDTLSQTAALSVAGSAMGGLRGGLLAAGCFVSGMIASSGLNGLWISHLVGLASRRAAIAGRLMVVVIGTLNLVIGLLALSRLLSSSIDVWSRRQEVLISLMVMIAVTAAFLCAMVIGLRRSDLIRSAA